MSQALLRHSDKRQHLRPLTKQGDIIVHRSQELSACCRVDVSERDKLGAVGVAKAQQQMKVKYCLPAAIKMAFLTVIDTSSRSRERSGHWNETS